MKLLGMIILGVIAAIIILIAVLWLLGLFFTHFGSPTNALKHGIAKWLLRVVAFLSGAKIEVVGKENIPHYKGKKGYAVVGNHQSNFDVFVVRAVLEDPLGFMAKIEISRWPLIGTWASAIGSTFIDRENLRQSYGIVMGKTTENIKNGLPMMVFPAGTRSKSNEVLPFKPGSFKVATSQDAPILPITLVDVYKAPKVRPWNRITMTMVVHPMIEAEEYKELTSFALAKKVEEIVTAPIETYAKMQSK